MLPQGSARVSELGESTVVFETSSRLWLGVGQVKNVLFVCSRNQWRSPTAQAVWRTHPGLNVRSAGTSTKARRTVGAPDIAWADVILVMEQKHKRRLQAEFARMLGGTPVHVLDIPDEYRFMDPELVETLESSMAACLSLSLLGDCG